MFTAWELSHQTRMPNGSDRPEAEPLQPGVDRNDSAGLWLGNDYCCAPVIHTTPITFRFTQPTGQEVLVKLAQTTNTDSVDLLSNLHLLWVFMITFSSTLALTFLWMWTLFYDINNIKINLMVLHRLLACICMMYSDSSSVRPVALVAYITNSSASIYRAVVGNCEKEVKITGWGRENTKISYICQGHAIV